jgi:UDP-GlcNAc:undecaprenyl-phosphate GlcNAc-1-phosphate transferase
MFQGIDCFIMPLLSYCVAFGVTLLSILLLKPLALRLGLIDVPGGRKLHEGNIPVIGGIAMLSGFSFALLTLDVSLSAYRCLIAGSGLLVITGLLDDFQELTPRSRLFIQILAGILMAVWGNVSLQSLGNLFSAGEIKLGFFAIPVTILAVVTIINAVNMTDGTDGLAGSIAFIEFFYLAWLASHANQSVDEQVIILIIAILLAFLCFNFPWRQRPSIFMGDNGSMWLGFLLTWFCIKLSQLPSHAVPPAAFLWIMAIPIWDMSTVVFRRLIRGFSPFKADRGHLHHYLLQRGFSPLQVTLLISTLSVFAGAAGILGTKYTIPESILFISFVVSFILYFYILHYAWRNNR